MKCKVPNCKNSGTMTIVKLENKEGKKEVMKNKH